MRISDWSSDVCSSDLRKRQEPFAVAVSADTLDTVERRVYRSAYKGITDLITKYLWPEPAMHATRLCVRLGITPNMVTSASARSEEHTSELQSLMRTSYAVFCLKTKTNKANNIT